MPDDIGGAVVARCRNTCLFTCRPREVSFLNFTRIVRQNVFGRIKNIVSFSSIYNLINFTLYDAIKFFYAFYCLTINSLLIFHSMMLPS